MKRSLVAVLFAAWLLVLAGVAHAEGAPVVLTHDLVGYSQDAGSVTLSYAVQVQNRQDAPVGPLTLNFVPQPPFMTAAKTLTVDELGPGATADFEVIVVSSLLLDRNFFSRTPLPWAGKYTDAEGNVVDFPVRSRVGGGK